VTGVAFAAASSESSCALLDRNALGDISGLVYVAAAANRDVVGEEWELDYFEDR
jgi:hypothetical protein